jgi:cytochrome c-type biogenesis protein
MADVSLAGARLAGLISFLSPCVLPLVPGYISMLSGIGMEELREGGVSKGGLLVSAFSFVLGFSLVFISFGASASAVGSFLRQHRNILAPLVGGLILLFGFHLLGLLAKLSVRWGAILDALLLVPGITATTSGGTFLGLRIVHFAALGFLLGFAFAFGWTPCIGPILATVLALAAVSETVGRGVLLLAAYSAGLAIPFLLTARGIRQFLGFYKSFRAQLHKVELLSGGLLVVVGALVFLNRLTWLSGKLTFLNRFSL